MIMASLKFKEVLCLLYTGLLFLSGAVLIGFAAVLSYKMYYHFKFVPSETVGPVVVVFLVGIVHLLITWVGVMGPSKQHDFFIIMFVIFSVILLLVELAVGIWSLVLWSQVEQKSVQLMTESQLGYFKHGYGKEEWDRLESKLQCCGLNGTQDYIEQRSYPLSCFKCDEKDLVAKKATCLETHPQGCREVFVKYIERLLLLVALVGFLSGIYQVAGIASYILFYKGLKKERSIRAAYRASRLRQSLSSHTNRANPNNEAPAYAPTAPT